VDMHLITKGKELKSFIGHQECTDHIAMYRAEDATGSTSETLLPFRCLLIHILSKVKWLK
jgi:hypothetical protein